MSKRKTLLKYICECDRNRDTWADSELRTNKIYESRRNASNKKAGYGINNRLLGLRSVKSFGVLGSVIDWMEEGEGPRIHSQ